MSLSLDKVPIGTKVKVENILESNIRRKLLDMGIVPGLEISVKGAAPLGDPIEVFLRDYRLTLRKNEAKYILVKKQAQ